MRRTKQDAEKTREAILSAAVKVFRDKGVSRSTLEEIAKEAGTTRGAIYWHFKNKTDIFHELRLGLSRPFEQIIVPALSAPHPSPSALKEASRRCLLLVEEDPNVAAVLEIYYFKVEVEGSLESFWDEVRKEEEDYMRQLAAFFTRAKRNNALKPDISPEHAALGFVALFNGLIEVKLMHKDTVCLQECAAPVLDLFFSGIMPQ